MWMEKMKLLNHTLFSDQVIHEVFLVFVGTAGQKVVQTRWKSNSRRRYLFTFLKAWFVACNGLDPAICWETLGHACKARIRRAYLEADLHHKLQSPCAQTFVLQDDSYRKPGKIHPTVFFHCKISIQQLQFGCFHGSPSQVSSTISGKATLSSSFFTMFKSLFHHCSPQTSNLVSIWVFPGEFIRFPSFFSIFQVKRTHHDHWIGGTICINLQESPIFSHIWSVWWQKP